MSNAARTIRSHQPQPDHSETHEKGLSASSNVDTQELEEELRRRIRDEMTNLLPDDQDARRLSQQTYLLTEFLETKIDFAHLPKLRRRAIVHDHCHKKAVIKKTTSGSC